MKKVKIAIILCLTILVYVSCDSEETINLIDDIPSEISDTIAEEEEGQADTTAALVLPAKITTFFDDSGVLEIYYEYENNKLVKMKEQITGVESYHPKEVRFFYEEDKLVRTESYNLEVSTTEIATLGTYEYEDGIIKKIEFIEFLNGVEEYKERHVYTKNNEGNYVVRESYMDNSNTILDEFDYEIIMQDNGTIHQFWDDDEEFYQYSWDEKSGIFKNVHQGELFSILPPSHNQLINLMHNPLTVSFSLDASSSSFSETVNYSYEYNHNGFPVKIDLNTVSQGDSYSDTIFIEYE